MAAYTLDYGWLKCYFIIFQWSLWNLELSALMHTRLYIEVYPYAIALFHKLLEGEKLLYGTERINVIFLW